MKVATPLFVTAIFLSGCAAPDTGSHQSGDPAFSHSLGSATAQDSGAKCSIAMTAPSGSSLNGQKLNFVLERGEFGSWTRQEFPVSTGTSKSLAELQSLLGNALHRGLAASAGTQLAKVGDIQFGGEVRLIARGGGAVDFAYQPAVEGGNPVLSPGETAAFAKLLGK
jgi:hypothetical protein